MAVCVAVIGKENNPLYIRCAKPEQVIFHSAATGLDCSLQELSLHYTVHTSLDVVEEKLAATNQTKSAGSSSDRELYLGSLYASEHQKVFGYVTNTKIKLVIVVDNTNTTLRDNEIRQMFRRLHTAYTNVIANPFFTPGESIASNKFDASVKSILGFREN